MMLPEIQLDPSTISTQARKLKAVWSQEVADDLRAMHNLDAEAELSKLLAAEINAEIDQEILNDLRGLTSPPPQPVFVPPAPETPWGVRKKAKKQYRSIDEPWET